MRAIFAPLCLLTMCLPLTSCSSSFDSAPTNPDQVYTNTVEQDFKLKDGRTVHCLVFKTGYPSLSCDWNNAHR